MLRKTLFTCAFLICCIPNQIFTFALSCNGHYHVDVPNLSEEQAKMNHVESSEDGSQKNIVANHPNLETLPISLDELDNDNINKYYNKLYLMQRKFYYPQQRKPDGLGHQWPNEFRPFLETRKRSEKGMLLDAPEFILNPNAGSGGNSRRVGGLMKSSG